jgi:hypothetical protein
MKNKTSNQAEPEANDLDVSPYICNKCGEELACYSDGLTIHECEHCALIFMWPRHEKDPSSQDYGKCPVCGKTGKEISDHACPTCWKGEMEETDPIYVKATDL